MFAEVKIADLSAGGAAGFWKLRGEWEGEEEAEHVVEERRGKQTAVHTGEKERNYHSPEASSRMKKWSTKGVERRETNKGRSSSS